MTTDNADSSEVMLMVVEDDIDSRTLLKRVLESEGFAVKTAADGQEALLLLECDPLPQLILVDITMPKMPGEDFIQHVRKSDRLKPIKLVLISGWDDIAKRAQNLGVHGYIRKPVDLRTLCRQIERLLKNE